MAGLMTPTSAAEAVANGAQLLDERYPGWWKLIDLGTLRMSNGCLCVAGQLAQQLIPDWSTRDYVAYHVLVKEVGEHEFNLGFNIWRMWFRRHLPEPDTDWTMDDLQDEWVKAIQARLDADTQTPVEAEAAVGSSR